MGDMHPRDLSDLDEYRAGRGIEEVAREHDLDPESILGLASNENPLGPSQAAVEAIRMAAATAHQYPKAAHTDLQQAVAEHWAVSDAQVWLANGGDGALDYLSRAILTPGDRVLTPTPGFAYYGMATRYHHGRVNSYSVEKAQDFAVTPETVLNAYSDERIVYLNSPHNPTGRRIPRETIEAIARRTNEQTLVVVDEAYGEFMDGPSAIDLLDRRDDIAVLRTFSKAYGLAGCRLGYALVPEAWADAYTRVNTPFAASELACRAGLAALADDDHVKQTVELVAWSRSYMREQLAVPTWESHGNFVLADVGDAAKVDQALQERGIVVRDCTSFGLPGCVRITCGTRDATRRAVRGINDVIEA